MTNRQPKGIPEGGQFSEGRKPEGGELAHVMPQGFSVATQSSLRGGALVGTVTTTYADLVRVFGPPQFDDESDNRDKSTAEWWLNTPVGTAYIYDFDDEDQRPLHEFAWHIGSNSDDDVVFEIKKALGQTFGSHNATFKDFGDGDVPAHQHTNGGGWVADTAHVEDTAFIGPDAKVCGEAQVKDFARVIGHSIISDYAVLAEHALVDDSGVQDHAVVGGESRVLDRSVIRDHAMVGGYATVSRNVDVYGEARIFDHASAFNRATVGDTAWLCDHATLYGPHAHLYGPAALSGHESYDLIG